MNRAADSEVGEQVPPPLSSPRAVSSGPPVPYQRHSLTSLEAALSMQPHLHRMEKEIMELFTVLEVNGWTDAELIEEFRTQSARPRRIKLVQLGLLKDSGRTRRTRTGRKAVVWTLA